MTPFDVPILIPSSLVQIVGAVHLSVADGWTLVQQTGDARNISWWVDTFHPNTRRQVAVSCLQEQDGHPWLHVSVARRHKMPSYADLSQVKRDFLGDRKAIMVFASAAEHVNLHPFCLHLFSCIGHDPLPDFTGGTPYI